jgi:hypothetical protein
VNFLATKHTRTKTRKNTVSATRESHSLYCHDRGFYTSVVAGM